MLTKTLLLVSATYCFIIIASEKVPTTREVGEKCRQEYHLEEEEIAILNETRYLETENEKIKCFVKCFLTGLMVMDGSGEFTLEESDVKNQEYKKHFDVCKEVNGTDICDKAVNFQNCMLKLIDSAEKAAE